jgi:hypothetical protein
VEEGETPDIEKWAARVLEGIEDARKDYKPSKVSMKVALEEAQKDIEAARKATRKAA